MRIIILECVGADLQLPSSFRYTGLWTRPNGKEAAHKADHMVNAIAK